MATYLVTGGCGFIGSHLCRALMGDGHMVRVLDDFSNGSRSKAPPAADVIEADVADAEATLRAFEGVDGCFHLAANASVEVGNTEWLKAHRTNLTGAIAVFDAARRANPRPTPVVYASSAAVYGASTELPLTEGARSTPISAYGADKLGCEQHALVAGHVHGVPTCGLRMFNVYGPGQDPLSPYAGAVARFAARIAAGEPPVVYGDGSQSRDFICVDDAVRAIATAMSAVSRTAPVFNVCTGRGTSINGLIEILLSLYGVTMRPLFRPARAGDIHTSIGSTERAWEALGFRSRVGFQEGLGRLL